MKIPSISVIIPALNAGKTLEFTLTALSKNTKKPDEVIVIDGLSEDDTHNIAEKFGCRIEMNNLRHVSAARQVGVNASQCEIIAMTDADCIPTTDWLERILYHFSQDPDLDGVGGIAKLSYPVNRVQSYCAAKSVLGMPVDHEYIWQKGMRGRFAGSNCAYKRNALNGVGGYDLALKNCGCDIDLFWRLIENKSRLLFDPLLQVDHLGFSTDIRTLAHKSFGYGIASAWLAHKHFPKKQFDLRFYGRPWSAMVKELFNQNSNKYPELVFVDNLMFAFGRTWGSFRSPINNSQL